jgi:protein-S-isoprenylcysteine O-methyltransferase Ste14
MDPRRLGWLFVAAQVVLLVSLVLLPGGSAWPTPGWVEGVGLAISLFGALLAVVASRRLGRALTPTPVPAERGELTTAGLYGLVRHPIYTGVLLIVLGIVVRSGSVLALAVGAVTLVFFTVKARWEEGQLLARYPAYRSYAAAVPRFIPSLFVRH